MSVGSLSEKTIAPGRSAPEAGDPAPRRPQALDAGLFLVVVAVPLAVVPFLFSPFADAKIVLPGLGTWLIWLGGLRCERRIAIAAATWFAVSAIAASAGVDPIRSLFGWDETMTGLLMLGPCAYLVVAGASLPADRVRRLQGWVVWVGLAMAASCSGTGSLRGSTRSSLPAPRPSARRPATRCSRPAS